jgi:protein-S-isoprenylcysteine O-methyltransferase Ste14
VIALWLKNLLFTLVVPGTVAIYLPLLLSRGLPPAGLAARLLSLPIFAAGIAIYAWCVWDFATFGGGTPAPVDAPRRLVVRGLYHYTRNPMYVGVLTTILGWLVRHPRPGLLVYAGFIWLAFQTFIVLYEEPHLAQLFGGEYAAYRSSVSRWLPRPG